MRWLLLWFLGTTGALIVAVCIVILFARHRLHRLHRVDPHVATAAPVTWVADPRGPARLHRRLTRVGRAAGAVADDHRVAKKLRRTAEQPPLVDIALDLRRQAVRLDHELTRIALLPPGVRRPSLQRLSQAVAELEHTSLALVRLSAEVKTPPVLASEHDDITDVGAQVARLAAAHQELLALDAAAGLATPVRGTAAHQPTR